MMPNKESKEMDTDAQRDTSLPGREEEVIDNSGDVQKTEPIKTILTKDIDVNKTAEKTYQEGLQNNSDTGNI